MSNENKDENYISTCTLHVCPSCRPPGLPREPKDKRPGFLLYKKLEHLLKDNPLEHQVSLNPADCLSLCKALAAFQFHHPAHGPTYLVIKIRASIQDIRLCFTLP